MKPTARKIPCSYCGNTGNIGGIPCPVCRPGSAALADRPHGIVYLLHFDQPYVPYPGAPRRDCAQHYTGRVLGGPRSLRRRLKQHGTLQGARLMLAARGAGITWRLARTWTGGAERERQLKRQGGAVRRCPLCGVTPRPGDLPRNTAGGVARSLVPDARLALAGLMTRAELSSHAELRRGAAVGRAPGMVRLGGAVPADDPWYAVPAPAVAMSAGAREAGL